MALSVVPTALPETQLTETDWFTWSAAKEMTETLSSLECDIDSFPGFADDENSSSLEKSADLMVQSLILRKAKNKINSDTPFPGKQKKHLNTVDSIAQSLP